MTTLTKRLSRWAIAVALLLMVPLVAMRFTSEVNWNLFDFVFMGTLLFGSALVYELVTRKMADTTYRGAVGIAVIAAVLLVWVNGAVGIIGNENNPANLMYFGVIAVGLIGAAMSRFQPSGMTRTLFTVAAAQMLVPTIALIISRPSLAETPGIVGVFGLNLFFAMLWVLSAILFRQASTAAPR